MISKQVIWVTPKGETQRSLVPIANRAFFEKQGAKIEDVEVPDTPKQIAIVEDEPKDEAPDEPKDETQDETQDDAETDLKKLAIESLKKDTAWKDDNYEDVKTVFKLLELKAASQSKKDMVIAIEKHLDALDADLSD